MTSLLLAARINSRLTSSDEFELCEKTSTMMRLWVMATIDGCRPDFARGYITGAIQQRVPADSGLHRYHLQLAYLYWNTK